MLLDIYTAYQRRHNVFFQMKIREVMFQFELSFIEMLSNLLACLGHLHCLTELLHCNLIGTLKVGRSIFTTWHNGIVN